MPGAYDPTRPTALAPQTGGGGGTGSWFEQLVNHVPFVKPVLNALSTVLEPITKVTDAEAHVMSFTGVTGGRLLTGDPRWNDLGQTWDATANVSPGQAVLSLPFFQQPLTQKILGNEGKSPFGGAPLNRYGTLDVTNPDVRRKAFESGGLGEISSFATDAAIQYEGNPLVVGGFAARPTVNAIRGIAPFGTAENALAAEKAQLGVLGTRIGHGQDPIGAWQRGHAELYANRHNIGYVLERLGRNPIAGGIRDPETVATALAGTRDFDEYMTVFMAARGDLPAYTKLLQQHAALKSALDDADAHLDWFKVSKDEILKKDPITGETTSAWKQNKADIKEWTDTAHDLQSRSAWYAKMLGNEQDDTVKLLGLINKNAVVTDHASLNALRRTTARGRATSWLEDGFWTDQQIKPIAGAGRIVQIMNWAGRNAPRGWVQTAGGGAADGWRNVRDILKTAKMDDETTSRWVLAFTKAPTAAERQQVLQSMDNDVIGKIFAQHLPADADDAMKAEAVKWAQAFGNKVRRERDDAITAYRQADNWMHDVESGRSTKIAPLDSMEAQNVAITDYGLLHQALGEFGQAGIKKMLLTGRDYALDGTAVFSGMWKTAVLLRVGAIPRNLGESWLASWVFLGRFPTNPALGAGEAVGNLWRRAADRYAANLSNPEIGGLSWKQMSPILGDRVQILENNVAHKTDALTELIAGARSEGAPAYYADIGQHTPVLHTDVGLHTMEQITTPGRRAALTQAERERYAHLGSVARSGTLRKELREEYQGLNAKATRAYLRQTNKGRHVVVQRNGEHVQVPLKDLTDADLAGQVYTAQRYKDVLKGAPSPADAAQIIRNQEFPDHLQIYGQDARDEAAAIQASIARDQAAIDATRADIAQIEQTIARRRPGTQGDKAGTAAGYEYTAPRPPDLRDIIERNIGAQGKNQLEYSTYETQGFKGRQITRAVRENEGSHIQYDPTDPLYFAAAAEFANRMVRNSTLAMRLLQTNDPIATAYWLRNTAQGRGVLRQLNLSHTTEEAVQDWTRRAHHNLFKAYPNEALRADIMRGEVTEAQVRAYLENRDDLVPTIAREYVPVVRSRRLADGISLAVNRAFQAIWSLPENKLARYPLYDQLYRSEMNRSINQYLGHLSGMSEADANQFIRSTLEPNARLWAEATTKRVVYSSQTRNNVAEKLRFISPFMQVTGNRFYYYGTQVIENPQNIARMFVGWNAIPTTTDSQGNQIFYLHLPGPVARRFGLESTPTLAFNKQSANLIQNGEPWWSPGAGPIVTVPMGELLRRNADSPIAQYMTKALATVGVFPEGYLGQSVWDQVLPTFARRYLAGEGQQGANTQSMLMAIETWNYENHLRDTPPTLEEINERNDQLWAFRVLGAFVLPAQPQIQNDMVRKYTDIHRTYVTKYGKDAEAHFLADYPEYYDVVLSYTKNPTGIAPTQSASARESANQYLIADLAAPEMAAMVTNLPGQDGNFDQSAYYWQMNRAAAPGSDVLLRTGQSPQDAVAARITSRGWLEYDKAAKERDSLLLAAKMAGGSDSIRSNDNAWIAALFDSRKAAIIKDTTVARSDGSWYSPWDEAFKTEDNARYAKRADALRQILKAPGYVKANIGVQPWLASAAQYLDLRDEVTDLLARNQAAGGSGSIDAKENTWLQLLWDMRRKQISDADPEWKTWSNRYFANDDLTVNPAGAQ